jgi:hypothetical protein
VKKIISIGVALALLAMVVVPVAVSADTYTPPQSYAKIPFGILGSALELVANIWPSLASGLNITGMDWIGSVANSTAGWVATPFAWLADLTGWTLAAVGDMLSVIKPLADTLGFGNYTGPLANMTYVLSARIFDPWGSLPGGLNTTFPVGFGVL